MQTPADSYTAEITELEKLGAELTAHGLHTALQAPPARLPYLHVTNPRASVLAERVYAQAGSFWWSWAERISGSDQVAEAAAILARVLRTVDGP